jgi:hypothetical protein
MNRIIYLPALALALIGSAPGLAQSPTGATPSSAPTAAMPQTTATPQKADRSALTIEKLTRDLQKAGFSEVIVLEDAFLVQAKTKDGNPILMSIGSNGISSLEVTNLSGTNQNGSVKANPDSGDPSASGQPAQR